MTSQPTTLILDFGGVLTNDFWQVLRTFARAEGLDENALVDLVTKDSQGSQWLKDLERGKIGQAAFEERMSQRLGVERNGLLARMAADLQPDDQMLAIVADLKAHGVKIAILSNSWGSDYFDPYAPWNLQERADIVIISDQVQLRKPDPEIFDLVLDKLGVPAPDCVFVDDIAAYLEPALDLGMTVVHHTNTDQTTARLRQLFARFLQ